MVIVDAYRHARAMSRSSRASGLEPELQVDSTAPVGGSTAIVSDRQDVDLSLGDQVDQAVRKSGYRDSSHLEVL